MPLSKRYSRIDHPSLRSGIVPEFRPPAGLLGDAYSGMRTIHDGRLMIWLQDCEKSYRQNSARCRASHVRNADRCRATLR